jgi:hypothetical protein
MPRDNTDCSPIGKSNRAAATIQQPQGTQRLKRNLGPLQHKGCQAADWTVTTEAVVALERSLTAGQGQFDAFDLFFLAMAHQSLGHHEDAKQCFDRGVRWLDEHKNLPSRHAQDLAAFRAEAEAVLVGPAGEMSENVYAGP